jgi:hypothetical protein
MCSVRRLPVTASVVPSSPILVTLMKEALSSYETSVLTRATRLNFPQDAVLRLVDTFSSIIFIVRLLPNIFRMMKSWRVWRTPYSGMLRRVALVTTDGLEEGIASIIRVIRIGELGETLAVLSPWWWRHVLRLLVTANVPSSSILISLKMEEIRSSEMATRATRRHIPEDDILLRS